MSGRDTEDLALGDHSVPVRRRRIRPLVVLLPAAALIGLIGCAGTFSTLPTTPAIPAPSIASARPSSTASPSAMASPNRATVDGLNVQSVSELLAARANGQAPGGPYALHGYWTNRTIMHSCGGLLSESPGELELHCSDGDWGITEQDEEILRVEITSQGGGVSIARYPTSRPHLTPWVPSASDQQRLFSPALANGQFWPPVPITVIGHFDDPKAAECRPEARQLCLDQFVIDRIVDFDPNSVPGPTPSPTPTPFPIANPPPAPFTNDECYRGVPKKFTGWILFNDLHIGREGPGYVYAMVTRDVIRIGKWRDNPRYPGHETRLRARGVCFAVDDSGMGFGQVVGTTYLEVDDGRHIYGAALEVVRLTELAMVYRAYG